MDWTTGLIRFAVTNCPRYILPTKMSGVVAALEGLPVAIFTVTATKVQVSPKLCTIGHTPFDGTAEHLAVHNTHAQKWTVFVRLSGLRSLLEIQIFNRCQSQWKELAPCVPSS